jgi:Flp pilus assembly pilin Flp
VVEWVRRLAALRRWSKSGQSMVEYSVLLVLVSLVAITILGTIGSSVITNFTTAVTAF